MVGDPGGMKYSPLAQITPANVAQLKEAWSYAPGGPSPIVINNVMYFFSAGNVTALNAENGTEVWKYTYTEVECLGLFGTAPVVQVNNDYYENMDVAQMEQLLEKLK